MFQVTITKTSSKKITEVGRETERFVDAGTAEALLGVTRKTLVRWAQKGLIVYTRPNGRGKWLFDVGSIGVSAACPIARKNTSKEKNEK